MTFCLSQWEVLILLIYNLWGFKLSLDPDFLCSLPSPFSPPFHHAMAWWLRIGCTDNLENLPRGSEIAALGRQEADPFVCGGNRQQKRQWCRLTGTHCLNLELICRVLRQSWLSVKVTQERIQSWHLYTKLWIFAKKSWKLERKHSIFFFLWQLLLMEIETVCPAVCSILL